MKKAAKRAQVKTASTRAAGNSEKAPRKGAKQTPLKEEKAPMPMQKNALSGRKTKQDGAPERKESTAAPLRAEDAAPKKETAEKSPSAPSAHGIEADESAPRSTPVSASDRYIRKRLTLSELFACDPSTGSALSVGTRLDFAVDPDAPHEKNAVALLLGGDKVGYLAPQDQTAFAACLRLKQNIYGIVTAVKEENGQTVYEIEAWFASQKRDI